MIVSERRNFPKRLTFLTTVIVVFINLNTYGQRSYRYENYGNKSVLLNGNVTGSVTDLGAVFYNPARLALVENPKFSIEGKFYERSMIRIDDFLGEGINIENPRFNALPGLVAGSVKLGTENFYYSFLSRSRIDVDASFDTGLLDADNSDLLSPGQFFNTKIGITMKVTEEWFGLSWGKKLKDNFSIGISMFASFYNYSGTDAIRFVLLNEDDPIYLSDGETSFEQHSMGLFFKLGAAWKLPSFDLGINIDLPYLEISQKGNYNGEFIFASGNTGADILTIAQFDNINSKRKVPLGVNIGAGIPIDKHVLHLNADWHAPVSAYDRLDIPPIESVTEPVDTAERKEELKGVLNFGFGTELYLTKTLGLYLSFTTDFSPVKRNESLIENENGFGEENLLTLDNYHFGGGVNIDANTFHLVFGAVYTTAAGDFQRAITLPVGPTDFNDDNLSVSVDRFRLLVGFNIPLN
ncbi:hypothetical protein [Robertkochia solimangrovi]|uniref:hypothetical protein n=1 Tax=Robertkochia solimangrovi TaxID=2213046 RepID=UPI00117DC66F|nr:hypothetical protein [Robertkochia solimangrovi]TRZ41836.1 hypothetical protein DMZ48_15950 [Robertkochia solimangrovi]